jgi:hypothetical protein
MESLPSINISSDQPLIIDFLSALNTQTESPPIDSPALPIEQIKITPPNVVANPVRNPVVQHLYNPRRGRYEKRFGKRPSPPAPKLTENLNLVQKTCANQKIAQIDNSVTHGDISIYFRNQLDKLVDYIKEADAVVGCIAWLASDKIITALQQVKHGVNIVVQKESWIKPHAPKDEKLTPYEKYQLMQPYCPVDMKDVSDEIKKSAVRCCGVHGSWKGENIPRMHNKFLVFGEIREGLFEPYAVWTGSTNMSHNSENSLENAIYIKNSDVARAYEKEWREILAISEGLDWKTDDCVPDIRF